MLPLFINFVTKNMKRILIFGFLLLMLWQGIYCESQNSTYVKKYITIIRRDKNVPGRPRIPSHQQIEAYYIDDILSITFGQSEGEANLVLYLDPLNQDKNLGFTFDSSEPADLNVGILNLPVAFTITTALANEYEGIIYETE